MTDAKPWDSWRVKETFRFLCLKPAQFPDKNQHNRRKLKANFPQTFIKEKQKREHKLCENFPKRLRVYIETWKFIRRCSCRCFFCVVKRLRIETFERRDYYFLVIWSWKVPFGKEAKRVVFIVHWIELKTDLARLLVANLRTQSFLTEAREIIIKNTLVLKEEEETRSASISSFHVNSFH